MATTIRLRSFCKHIDLSSGLAQGFFDRVLGDCADKIAGEVGPTVGVVQSVLRLESAARLEPVIVITDVFGLGQLVGQLVNHCQSVQPQLRNISESCRRTCR